MSTCCCCSGASASSSLRRVCSPSDSLTASRVFADSTRRRHCSGATVLLVTLSNEDAIRELNVLNVSFTAHNWHMYVLAVLLVTLAVTSYFIIAYVAESRLPPSYLRSRAPSALLSLALALALALALSPLPLSHAHILCPPQIRDIPQDHAAQAPSAAQR